jgi:hypothetical protein
MVEARLSGDTPVLLLLGAGMVAERLDGVELVASVERERMRPKWWRGRACREASLSGVRRRGSETAAAATQMVALWSQAHRWRRCGMGRFFFIMLSGLRIQLVGNGLKSTIQLHGLPNRQFYGI